MEDFPGNSQRARRPVREEIEPKPAEDKKLEKVVEGEVIRRKKPMSRRIRDSLVGDDAPQTAMEFVLYDILIPGIRDIFVDATTGGIERLAYRGDSRAAHRRIRSNGGPLARTNYQAFGSQPVSRGSREDPRTPLSRQARSSFNFDQIYIDSRPEAEMVLDGLFSILERYEQVTVADLYELVGISSNFTELRYGWTDLRGSRVEHTRHGYLLNLPKPGLLER